MNNAQISIIVPVYNVEKYLEPCVDSILAQTYDNWEAWLVDDGSTDQSGAMCEEFARRDSRFHVLHKKNGGQSSARNMALRQINGEYITFLDSDDYWEPEALEWLMTAARKTQAEIVCMGVRLFRGEKTEMISYPQAFEISGEEAFRRMMICDGLDSNVWAKIYRSELWNGIFFPEGCQFEDVPVSYRLLLNSKRVVHCGKVGYHYRSNPTSTTHTFSTKRICYTDFTKEVLQFTRERYPQYLDEAKELYAHSMMVNLVAMGKTEIRKMPQLVQYEKKLRRDVLPYAMVLFRSSRMNSRSKLDFLLCLLGLFRPLRRLSIKISSKNTGKLQNA